MDLLRPWLVTVAAWIVMNVIITVGIFYWSTTAQLLAFETRIFWLVIPHLLVGGVPAIAATYLHRRPERADRRRNALAGLGACGVMAVIEMVLNLFGGLLSSAILAFVAEAVGAVLGWLFVSRVARRAEHDADTGSGYF